MRSNKIFTRSQGKHSHHTYGQAPPACGCAAPRSWRWAFPLGMCDRSAPAEMPAGTPTGRCPLAWPRTGRPCAPLSVQKHAYLSCQFGENLTLRKNGNFWRDPRTFVHDCLVFVSSVLRCVGEQIFLTNDNNITVHSQAMAARYQIQREKNFASWSFLCIIMFSMYFPLKGKSQLYSICQNCFNWLNWILWHHWYRQSTQPLNI